MSGLIEDFALVGNLQTAALIGRNGTLEWGCFPRFDSPAAFSNLVGYDDHGPWQLGPLLAEEWDPRHQRHQRQVGNYPQAFSHLGVIDSAVALQATASAGAGA
jgi:GH15 family glucan-1,4-alpha-glucosidase